MNHLSNAIDALKSDEAMFKKTLIGGGILILSLLVVPFFFFQGYLMQILKDTKQQGLDKYPEWDNWGSLFIAGIIAFGINLLFTLPSQLLIYAPEVMEVSGQKASSGAFALMSIGYLISFIVGYLTPIIYVMYFREEGTVTDFSRIKSIAFSSEYFIAYLVVFAIGVAAGVALFVLILFTIGLGLIAVPFLFFPVQCVSMYIFGSAITEADPVEYEINTTEEETKSSQDDDYSVEYAT